MTDPAAFHIHTMAVGTAGAPVVFLHGLMGQGRNFTQIAKALQPECRSLLIDLPNHGRSDWTEAVDYEQLADLVAAQIRAELGDGPVHLVGHSMGGKVAMVLALRHPQLIARLVIVDITPVPGGSTGEFEHLLDSLLGLDLSALERRADADAALREPIADATVRGFLLQNLRSGSEGFRWQANVSMLRRDLGAIAGFPSSDGAVFDGPVLWVAGQNSGYIEPEHAEPMRALFPRTRQLTVKDAGHWVHSEQPEVFVWALRSFFGEDA